MRFKNYGELTRNILIKSTLQLETIRNQFFHSRIIQNFYENLVSHLPDNPKLLLNCDETASSFNSKGKVIVPDGYFSIRYEIDVNIHFTSVCAFNADGYHLRPFIILPKLRNFPSDLYPFASQAMFASSNSGWMTKRLFTAFALFFCHEISCYRISNNISERIWLILDGHNSRINSHAIEYFVRNNISILVIPAHTSHVCQPFDVGLSAPMKAKIRTIISNPPASIARLIAQQTTQASKTRILVVAAIINAWNYAAIPANCSSAFLKAGIYPYDVDRVLSNKFVRVSTPEDGEPVIRGININGSELTSDEKRIIIANKEYHTMFSSTDQIPGYDGFYLANCLKTGPEIVLTDFPKLLLSFLPGVIFHF